VFDLEYLGVGKDLPEQQLSEHYSKEEISAGIICRRRRRRRRRRKI
jgi:hypothetical protein